MPSLRFQLQERLFDAGEGYSYWRARESRSGRERVVRVIEAQTGTHPKWLEQLHRERAFADRFDSPQVLRTLVPQVDGVRIVQAVEGEPVRLLRFEGGQRMSALRAALRITETLAQCHARGQAHGALSPATLLATTTGDPLICGFGAAGGSAHDLRRCVARDVWDAIDRIAEILAPSGGPPARLRQLFESGEPLRGMDPMFGMAWLRDELRNALEDTFPWPVLPREPRPVSRPEFPAWAPQTAPVEKPEAVMSPPEVANPAAAVPAPTPVPVPAAPATPTQFDRIATPQATSTSPAASMPQVARPEPLRKAGSRGRWWAGGTAAVVVSLLVLAYFSIDARPKVEAPQSPPRTVSTIGPTSPVELERAVSAAISDAEARLQSGEPDVAHAWFEHALSLDPANERARRGLEVATAAMKAQRPGPVTRLLRGLGFGAP